MTALKHNLKTFPFWDMKKSIKVNLQEIGKWRKGIREELQQRQRDLDLESPRYNPCALEIDAFIDEILGDSPK